MPVKSRSGKRKPGALSRAKVAEQQAFAKSQWVLGDSIEDIAKKVGRSPRTVYRWVTEFRKDGAVKVDSDAAQLGEAARSVKRVVADAQEFVSNADQALTNVLGHYERVAAHLAELEDRRKQFEYRQQKISEAFLSYVARGIQSAQRYPDPFAHIKEMDALSRIHERVIRCYYGSKGALEGLGSMELDLSGVDEDTLLRLIQEQPRTKKQQDAEISQQQLDITAQEVV